MTTISLILNNYGNFCYDFVLKNKFGQKHLGGKSLKLIFLVKNQKFIYKPRRYSQISVISDPTGRWWT